MKILTVTIPCYNSQDYMKKCIESILPGGEDVEILIVDDGSSDKTAEIADRYAARYPTIVKAIHQENGGHGEAVNTGIRNAAGIYFKVVDSDDWVDSQILKEIVETLKELLKGPETVDMFISNFVYDKVGARRKKVMQYRSALPKEEVFCWPDMKNMRKGHYILMHSVIYRTNLLRECGLELPKHTFYVDNLFVFQPLPYVKKMYYLDKVFYHYFIGRDDQSVNEEVMIRRIDQQIKVNKIMIDTLAGKRLNEKRLRDYMTSYLDIIMTVSSIMLLRSGTEENFEKKQELWRYLKAKDRKLYLKIRTGLLGRAMNLPGKGGRQMSVAAYKIVRKFVGFN
ncbi:MAG TPA: glycosyltransferase family 2 protein [Candidatus Limivivens intestinipullorum]|uniref:Glycosyltransferase family 2 protein n=1 Tax=Candidatus Limivivens intestinipullorum TaxID=2840858 RepID=A0A9D1JIW1_9FIRM|nr:glycosyltransferase family 2 protein [Candidatus Limivivens intestinipullorum]